MFDPDVYEESVPEDFDPYNQYPILTVNFDNLRILDSNEKTDFVFQHSSETSKGDHFLDFIKDISTESNTREKIKQSLEYYGTGETKIIRIVQLYGREFEKVFVDLKMQRIESDNMTLLVVQIVPRDFEGYSVFPADPCQFVR